LSKKSGLLDEIILFAWIIGVPEFLIFIWFLVNQLLRETRDMDGLMDSLILDDDHLQLGTAFLVQKATLR